MEEAKVWFEGFFVLFSPPALTSSDVSKWSHFKVPTRSCSTRWQKDSDGRIISSPEFDSEKSI